MEGNKFYASEMVNGDETYSHAFSRCTTNIDVHDPNIFLKDFNLKNTHLICQMAN